MKALFQKGIKKNRDDDDDMEKFADFDDRNSNNDFDVSGHIDLEISDVEEDEADTHAQMVENSSSDADNFSDIATSEDEHENAEDNETKVSKMPTRKFFESLDNKAMLQIGAWGLLAFFISAYFLPSFIYSIIFWTLMLVIFTYAYVRIPTVLGFILSESVTRFALFGYPFRVETLSLSPWISNGILSLRVSATDIRFANPEHFPHEWFVRCGLVDFIIAVPLSELPHILLWKTTKMPLKTNPDFECLVVLDIPHIEFDRISINFELMDGKFNINELTRQIAAREVDGHMAQKCRIEHVKLKLYQWLPTMVYNKLGLSPPDWEILKLGKWKDDTCPDTTSEESPASSLRKTSRAKMFPFRKLSRSSSSREVKEPNNGRGLEQTRDSERSLLVKESMEKLPIDEPYDSFASDGVFDSDASMNSTKRGVRRKIRDTFRGIIKPKGESGSDSCNSESSLIKGTKSLQEPASKNLSPIMKSAHRERTHSCPDAPKPNTTGKVGSSPLRIANDHGRGALTDVEDTASPLPSPKKNKTFDKLGGGPENSPAAVEDPIRMAASKKLKQTESDASANFAEVESRFQHGAMGKWHWPNKLQVTIIRARDLICSDVNLFTGERSIDPKITVRLRDQHFSTQVRYKTRNPMWNETFTFPVTDPSTLIHVTLGDQDFGRLEFVGQWRMTMKWLIMNPKYCWFHEKDFHCRIGMISGWFPLMNKKWRERGNIGDINMRIEWSYDPTMTIPQEVSRSALYLLDQNSKETNLRLGDKSHVKAMLAKIPVLYNIQRVTIRRVEFFLQDLFRGSTGQAERLAKMGLNCNSAGKVKIPSLEWTSAFRPRKGEPGITTYKVLYSFFIRGVFPKIFNSHIFGNALSQTASGFAHNVVTNTKDLFKGHLGFHRVVEKGRQLKKEFKTVGIHAKKKLIAQDIRNRVTGDDEDFLQDSRIEDILYKCTIVNPKTNEDLNPGLKNFVKCQVQFKGKTFFYRPVHRSETRKIDSNEIQLVALRLYNNDFAIHRKIPVNNKDGTIRRMDTKVTIFRFIDEESAEIQRASSSNSQTPLTTKRSWIFSPAEKQERAAAKINPLFDDRLKEWFDILKEQGINTVITEYQNQVIPSVNLDS